MSVAELFTAMVRNLPELTWARDAGGRYLACSQPFADFLGLAEQAIIGRVDAELPPGARVAAASLALPPGEASGERWLTWPGGARRGLFEVRLAPLPGPEAPGGVIGTARDITALHEAQAALHASETRYHTLFETLVNGVVYQATDGRIVDANHAASAILGLSRDQLEGRSSFDPRWHAIHEDGSPFPGEEHPAIIALRTGQPVLNTVMGVFHPLRSNYAWIKVNAVPMSRPGDEAPFEVYATFEDITVQRAAQEELAGYRRHLEDQVAERTAALATANLRLRRSDMRLQATFELSQQASELSESELLRLAINEAVRLTESMIGYLHFVHEDQETIELACWSDGARQTCTAPHEQHYPVSLAGIWADTIRTLRPVVHNDYQSLALRQGYPAGHATIARHLGVPVVDGGKVRLLLGVGNKASLYDEVDVRELWHIGSDLWRIIMRRRTEVALRESEGRYRALFEASTESLALLDVEHGHFIACNQAALAFYDAPSREALIGNTPGDYSPPTQPSGHASGQLVQSYIAQAFREGSAIFEWVHRKRDDTLFPALISLSSVRFQGKAHVLVIGRDISEQKRYEAELEQARDAAEAASRAKSAFLANMSHELRTPLSAVLGRVELLREEIYGPLNERQHAALATMQTSGAHLLALIADLLDLSKIEAGQITLAPEPVATESIVHAALQMIHQAAATKGIALGLETDGLVTTLNVDPRRFQQILVNLLSNAVKFTPEGGRVGLQITGDPEAQAASFTVWDTGIGIGDEDLPRLFKPFVQVDTRLSRTYEGSGLGLALVLRLAELHGGSVRVASQPGAGSRFSVVLPWAPATRRPRAAATGGPEWPGQGAAAGRLVLVAEDNLASAQLLLDYLPALGYSVALAQNGAEAVTMARELRPALILMDVQMPVLDGLAAIREIRATPELGATPIIAVTALAMPGDHERCLAAGADVYLTKPIALRALREVIVARLGPTE